MSTASDFTLRSVRNCVLAFCSLLPSSYGFEISDWDDPTAFATTPEQNYAREWWQDNIIIVFMLLALGLVVFMALLAYTRKSCSQSRCKEANTVENNSPSYVGPFNHQEMSDSTRPTTFYTSGSSWNGGLRRPNRIQSGHPGRNFTSDRADEPPPYHTAVLSPDTNAQSKSTNDKGTPSFDLDIYTIESPPPYFTVQDNLQNTGR